MYIKSLLAFLFLSILLVTSTYAGEIKGKVLDDNKQPIPRAVIRIKELPEAGAKTNEVGEYKINVPDGNYNIEISQVGLGKSTQQIVVKGDLMMGEIVLSSSAKKTNIVTVVGKKNKESENALLQEQKKATVIEEKIGAQEMSKKGVSDAGAAVAKITGVSKEQSGSSFFVRGLGDRYNSTSLNGLFLPSDNPELKNISLSFFPSDVIKDIAVSKTFNSKLNGDFGGAAINIETKDYDGKPFLDFGVSVGQNLLTSGKDIYSSGMNYMGVIPNKTLPTTNLNTYSFNGKWSPEIRNQPYLNSGFSLNTGSSKTKNGNTLGYFATMGLSSAFRYTDGQSNSYSNNGNANQLYNKTQSGLEVNKNIMLNFFRRNAKNEIKLNLLKLVNNTDFVNQYSGYNNSINEYIYLSRNVVENNAINIAQLLGSHKVSSTNEITWGIAYNNLKSEQPNRITNTLKYYPATNTYHLSTNDASSQNLYYQFLNENEISGNVGYDFLVSKTKEKENKLFIGFNGIYKHRDFDAYQYNFKALNANSLTLTPESLDQYFNQTNFESNQFLLTGLRSSNNVILPNIYTGTMFNGGLSANYNHYFSDKLNVSFGSKLEFIRQGVSWDVNIAAIPKGESIFNKLKFLPFVNAKYAISENSNFKGAISKTYTLPQFKEIAPFLYEDINSSAFGNPYLYTSNVYNFDLKYETFPKDGELISAGVFYKYIQNPINKTQVASSANEYSYVNSGDWATVFGLELEMKKKLYVVNKNEGLTGGLNLSLIQSKQQLNSDKVLAETNTYINANFTDKTAPLQGASPLLVNVDLSYKNHIKNYIYTITGVFNYGTDRLYSLGNLGAANQMEKGLPTLDIITKHQVGKNLQLSLNAKNILNPEYIRYQEINNTKYTVSSFRRGTVVSVGLTYKIF